MGLLKLPNLNVCRFHVGRNLPKQLAQNDPLFQNRLPVAGEDLSGSDLWKTRHILRERDIRGEMKPRIRYKLYSCFITILPNITATGSCLLQTVD